MFARTITFTVKKKGRANKLPLVILNRVCNYDYSGTDIISVFKNNAIVFFIKRLLILDFLVIIYNIIPIYSYFYSYGKTKKEIYFKRTTQDGSCRKEYKCRCSHKGGMSTIYNLFQDRTMSIWESNIVQYSACCSCSLSKCWLPVTRHVSRW